MKNVVILILIIRVRDPSALYKSPGAMIVQDDVMSKVFPRPRPSVSRRLVRKVPRFLLSLEAIFIKTGMFEQYLERIMDAVAENTMEHLVKHSRFLFGHVFVRK